MSLIVNNLHVEYITTSKKHGGSVDNFVKKYGFENDLQLPFSFSQTVIQSPLSIYERIRDLHESGCKSLTVIIDYQTIWLKTNYREYYSVLRDTILFFPEYNFTFDETKWNDKESKQHQSGFLGFIYTASSDSQIGDIISKKVGTDYYLDYKYHEFKFQASAPIPNPFKELLLGHNNLFDASNLRYFLKRQKYNELNLTENYAAMQKSRAKNLALCIEEERSQSLFNSLALFLNGFRVKPITSDTELHEVNAAMKEPTNPPSLIVRDYDLQFPDAPSDNPENIKKIRGWNYDDTTKHWINCINSDNPYWSHLNDINYPIYFISKGFESKPEEDDKLKIKHGKNVLKFIVPGIQPLTECHDDKKGILSLPGINKPVSGLYTPFRKIPVIKQTFDCLEKEEATSLFSTRRKDIGGHGVPLNLYSMVKAMVERAEKYYNGERYVHSVIVAIEAIEVMNGFHQALSLQAYRCQALAENAVAANILGTSENELAEDTYFRLERIETVISRISSIGNDRKKKSKNILNQIFNDIRIFCHNKEHFDAENVVVQKIIQLNEGLL